MANEITSTEFPWLKPNCSLGDLYDNAILLAKKKDKEVCERYLKEIISLLDTEGKSLVTLERALKGNIGYWAGYYTQEDRENVLEYFGAAHPILPLNCTAEEAMRLGTQAAELHSIEKQLRDEMSSEDSN